jgi:hypothetical protein
MVFKKECTIDKLPYEHGRYVTNNKHKLGNGGHGMSADWKRAPKMVHDEADLSTMAIVVEFLT